jgi:hypothetical protein
MSTSNNANVTTPAATLEKSKDGKSFILTIPIAPKSERKAESNNLTLATTGGNKGFPMLHDGRAINVIVGATFYTKDNW